MERTQWPVGEARDCKIKGGSEEGGGGRKGKLVEEKKPE